ncbi:MAG: hypothetical protein J6Z28_00040 [Succinivibrio sp.]|nr:hypothetical protein [Succinivibrio sp.]
MAIESALDVLGTSILESIKSNRNLRSDVALFSNVLLKNMLDSGVSLEKSLSKNTSTEKKTKTDSQDSSEQVENEMQETASTASSYQYKVSCIEHAYRLNQCLYGPDVEPVVRADGTLNPINVLFYNNIIFNGNLTPDKLTDIDLGGKIALVLYIGSLMKEYPITNVDISTFNLLNQCSPQNACNTCTSTQCYVIVLYIIGINLLFYIKDKKPDRFNYKDEKKKRLKDMKKKEDEQKENMKNFAAGFQFG